MQKFRARSSDGITERCSVGIRGVSALPAIWQTQPSAERGFCEFRDANLSELDNGENKKLENIRGIINRLPLLLSHSLWYVGGWKFALERKMYCCLEKDADVWCVAETCRCFGCWYFIIEWFARWLMTATGRNGYGSSRARVGFAGRCESAVTRVPSRATRKNISVLTKKKRLQKKSYLDWIFQTRVQNFMFGTSLTNAQSNLSNENLLFVKRENKRHW